MRLLPSLSASLMAQRLKRLPAMRETWVRPLGWEDPLEKEMATHSSILAWRIPWTEEPGRLQSMGSQRVGYDFTFTFPSLSVSCLCENLPSCFIGYLLGVPSFLESEGPPTSGGGCTANQDPSWGSSSHSQWWEDPFPSLGLCFWFLGQVVLEEGVGRIHKFSSRAIGSP